MRIRRQERSGSDTSRRDRRVLVWARVGPTAVGLFMFIGYLARGGSVLLAAVMGVIGFTATWLWTR